MAQKKNPLPGRGSTKGNGKNKRKQNLELWKKYFTFFKNLWHHKKI